MLSEQDRGHRQGLPGKRLQGWERPYRELSTSGWVRLATDGGQPAGAHCEKKRSWQAARREITKQKLGRIICTWEVLSPTVQAGGQERLSALLHSASLSVSGETLGLGGTVVPCNSSVRQLKMLVSLKQSYTRQESFVSWPHCRADMIPNHYGSIILEAAIKYKLKRCLFVKPSSELFPCLSRYCLNSLPSSNIKSFRAKQKHPLI